MPGNANKTTSETLKSVFGSIATPDTDIIIAGGPSKSELLNTLRDGILMDTVTLDKRTQDMAAQIAMMNTVFNAQLAALTSRFQSLVSRLPSTSGRWRADFYTNDYVVGGQTDAAVDNDYGQVTLRILSEQEKMVGKDTQGRIWVPKNAALNYSYKSSEPDEVDWLTDENQLFALDQRSDTAWWRERATSGTVWVRVRVPASLNANKLANCIILHPYPALTADVVSIEYRDPAGIYTTADLSYLTGWDGSKVAWAGNLRLFIPQTQVTELRIRLNTPNFWGFSKVSLKQIEFAPNATLTTTFQPFNPNSIDTTYLFGKDPDALAFLSTQVSGASPLLLVTTQLSQSTQNSSPVLTGIEAQGT